MNLANIITMFTAILICVASLSITPVFAQDAEPVDEIISRGSIQKDPAMSAWNAGDYETAEIEFGKNAFCALRAERNFAAALESARDGSIDANINSGGSTTVTPSGGTNGSGLSGVQPPPSSSTRLNSNNFKNKESKTKRTCEDRGFQLYMMGVSQLKLGKRDEAKKTLIRAAKMRRSLYDVHFRLSLLEYQDGDIGKANKHYKILRKLEPKCKGCAAKDEIKAQVQYLKNLLEK